MLPTGLVLLVFVVLHILDLTVGKLVAPAGFRHPDPQFHAATNVIASLDRPVMAVFYLFMLLALAIHFAHGIELAINDLGTTSEKGRSVARIIGSIVAVLVLVGDAAVVLSANLEWSDMKIMRGNLLDGKVPEASTPANRWDEHKQRLRLVSPSNRRKFHVLVVGTGLAGSGAASSLAELGFKVTAVSYHDSPRRAHSVAAQGGINAARGKRVDGDGLLRFVTDTIKGGDFRAREAEAWRLAEESNRVIDHLSAHGVPFT